MKTEKPEKQSSKVPIAFYIGLAFILLLAQYNRMGAEKFWDVLF